MMWDALGQKTTSAGQKAQTRPFLNALGGRQGDASDGNP